MRQKGSWSLTEILKAVKGKLVKKPLLPFFSGISGDSRVVQAHDLFIALKGRRYDGHTFIPEAIKKGATGIILDKKQISHFLNYTDHTAIIAVDNTLKALGEIASFMRKKYLYIPLIAITGSNGKTMTKEAIAHVLGSAFRVLKTKGNYNNQIGLAFTLLGLSDGYKVVCVEIATNAPGEINYLCSIAQPNIGVMTTIQPVHLEGLISIKKIQAEKGALLNYLNNYFVYNKDDPMVFELAKRFHQAKISFGINKGEVRAKDIVFRDNVIHFSLSLPQTTLPIKSKLLGRHQIYALLAAAAIGLYFKLSPKIIKQALESLSPMSGRLFPLRGRNGLFIIDDSYNANPASMETALKTLGQFQGAKIAVLGDMLELGESAIYWHKRAGEWAATLPLKALVIYGQYADFIKTGALGAGMDKDKIYQVGETEKIISLFKKIVAPSDIVLFKASHALGFENLVNILRAKL
jgi:UDP-N-acetylmuramoyl-tripeptide--D-alanyl-D-alanine ligase